jgi:hypothetical protein
VSNGFDVEGRRGVDTQTQLTLFSILAFFSGILATEKIPSTGEKKISMGIQRRKGRIFVRPLASITHSVDYPTSSLMRSVPVVLIGNPL